ncbi:MAG: hypothetical protein WC121_05245 [Candidatus Kapaibacterium sp.]
MKNKSTYINLIAVIFLISVGIANGKDTYIRSDANKPEILTYTFTGGSFVSYGCAGQDPTYFVMGSGKKTITVNFTEPQTNPSFRVWGLNDDDSVAVFVNEEPYPLHSKTASYDKKVICKEVSQDPGPEGVKFASGLLVGAISNDIGNYSYQNITLRRADITSITIVGLSGRGWGFAGVTISDGDEGQSAPRR